MKHSILLLALISLCSSCSRKKASDKQMPDVTGKTISGKSIDKSYFEGKITLVSFMYMGCPPCMWELNVLNNLHRDYRTDKDFQMLCIAPHTAEQLLQFNASDGNELAQLRGGAASIAFDILPECENNSLKFDVVDGNTIIKPECDRLSKPFGVDGYPKSFLIDKDGNIVKVYAGYAKDHDSLSLAEFKRDIAALQ